MKHTFLLAGIVAVGLTGPVWGQNLQHLQPLTLPAQPGVQRACKIKKKQCDKYKTHHGGNKPDSS